MKGSTPLSWGKQKCAGPHVGVFIHECFALRASACQGGVFSWLLQLQLDSAKHILASKGTTLHHAKTNDMCAFAHKPNQAKTRSLVGERWRAQTDVPHSKCLMASSIRHYNVVVAVGVVVPVDLVVAS